MDRKCAIYNRISVENKTQEENNDEINIDNLDVSEIETKEENVTENKKEKLTLGSISKYINSMKSLIPYWYIVQNPDEYESSGEVRAMLQKLNRLQFVYFKPLITVLLSKKEQVLKPALFLIPENIYLSSVFFSSLVSEIALPIFSANFLLRLRKTSRVPLIPSITAKPVNNCPHSTIFISAKG